MVTLTNSEDPDDMAHICNYRLSVFYITRGKEIRNKCFLKDDGPESHIIRHRSAIVLRVLSILFIFIFILESGAGPGFKERGFRYVKERGFALLILSHFSKMSHENEVRTSYFISWNI